MDYTNLCSFGNCVSSPHLGGELCAFHTAQQLARSPLKEQQLAPIMWIMAVADGYDPGRDEHGCIIWPFPSRSPYGYGVVYRRTKNGKQSMTPASRLLCELIHGPPEDDDLQAAHECGRGRFGCVTREDVLWKDRVGNQLDKERHGTVGRGEKNGFASLTEAMVVEILTTDAPSLELEERFPASSRSIRRIRSGERWGHVRDRLIAEGVQVFQSTTGAQRGDRNVNRRKKLERESAA